jgi:hypothetical protein
MPNVVDGFHGFNSRAMPLHTIEQNEAITKSLRHTPLAPIKHAPQNAPPSRDREGVVYSPTSEPHPISADVLPTCLATNNRVWLAEQLLGFVYRQAGLITCG